MCVESLEDNLQESVIPFQYSGPKDGLGLSGLVQSALTLWPILPALPPKCSSILAWHHHLVQGREAVITCWKNLLEQ